MKVPTQYTTVYTPSARGKVEKTEGQGADSFANSYRGTMLTFDQLREKLRVAERYNRPIPNLTPNMNPALAASITASNTNTIKSVEVYSKSDVDIFHDNSKRRGLTENIKV